MTHTLSVIKKVSFPSEDANLQVEMVWFIKSDGIKSKGTSLHRPMDQQLDQKWAALTHIWSCLITAHSKQIGWPLQTSIIALSKESTCFVPWRKGMQTDKNLDTSLSTTQCIVLFSASLKLPSKSLFIYLSMWVMRTPCMGVEICLLNKSYLFSPEHHTYHSHSHNKI